MNTALLEEILSCPRLPSLPAVAAQVIEMTSDPDVSIAELAKVIQQDQALAAKILRTVNSSFYGLRERCGSIDKALVLLGLSPVKSLVLGFSLVSAVPTSEDDDAFDFMAYWRRSLYSGVAAREIALAQKSVDPDEGFLAALFQDIGMMALHMSIPEEYAKVLLDAGGDHRQLMRSELTILELTHADIGGMLAERWKLPPSLVHPVRFHEKPSAAPTSCVDAARVVATANLVHDVLSVDDSVASLRTAYRRVKEWFRMEPTVLDEIIERTTSVATEMAKVLELDTGPSEDAEALLNNAREQLTELNRNEPSASSVVGTAEESPYVVSAVDDLDPLTGLISAAGLKASLIRSFAASAETGEPLGLANIEVGGLDPIIESGKLELADEAVLLISMYLKKIYEPLGGFIGRAGDGAFMVLVPGMSRVPMIKASEMALKEIRDAIEMMRQQDDWPEIDVNLNIGIAAWESQVASILTSPQHMVAASVKASQMARAAGGNCLRAFAPKVAA